MYSKKTFQSRIGLQKSDSYSVEWFKQSGTLPEVFAAIINFGKIEDNNIIPTQLDKVKRQEDNKKILYY